MMKDMFIFLETNQAVSFEFSSLRSALLKSYNLLLSLMKEHSHLHTDLKEWGALFSHLEAWLTLDKWNQYPMSEEDLVYRVHIMSHLEERFRLAMMKSLATVSDKRDFDCVNLPQVKLLS